MADLPGWPYWKVISITGQASAGTDYQIKLDIGDSAGGDFHLEGNCTNFPQDIRITDDDGTTLLDHWVEDITADPIKVWVEVKDNLDSNQTIRVYYGKSGETTVHDGAATFPEFFDDFLSDSGLWTKTGTISYSNSIVTIGSGADTSRIITPATEFSTGQSLRFRAKLLDDIDQRVLGSRTLDWVNRAYFEPRSDRTLTQKASVNELQSYTFTQNNWYNYNIHRNSTTNVIFTVDGGVTNTHATQVPTVDMLLDFYVYITENNRIQMDWVFVRKYNSPEPAFSSAGAEQSPTGVSPTAVFYGPLVGPFGGPI